MKAKLMTALVCSLFCVHAQANTSITDVKGPHELTFLELSMQQIGSTDKVEARWEGGYKVFNYDARTYGGQLAMMHWVVCPHNAAVREASVEEERSGSDIKEWENGLLLNKILGSLDYDGNDEPDGYGVTTFNDYPANVEYRCAVNWAMLGFTANKSVKYNASFVVEAASFSIDIDVDPLNKHNWKNSIDFPIRRVVQAPGDQPNCPGRPTMPQ